jgi:hypothetical protein
MNVIFFAIGVLLLMLVWHGVVRRAILDTTRDKLFDLRDEIRETYIQNGWDMKADSYRRIRALINAHLRFTEEMSLIKILVVNRYVASDREVKAFISERSRAMFSDTNEAQRAFIDDIRRRAISAVMNYAVFGSFVLVAIGVAFAPFYIAGQIFTLANSGVGSILAMCFNSIIHISNSLSDLIDGVGRSIASKIIGAKVLEGYSFRAGQASFC